MSIAKDISEVRKEYLKSQAKDDYIKLMEIQLDQALNLLSSLEVRLHHYEDVGLFSLDDSHLKILKMFKDSKTEKLVNDYIFPEFSDDDRIAFEELLQNKYIHVVSANIYGQVVYAISKDKIVEILKLLRPYKD